MARRPPALAGALVTAALLVGCGGDADPSAFADATDRTCQAVGSAVTTLQRDLVRAPGDSQAAAVRGAIERYAATVEATAKQLADAPARKADAAFQRAAVQRLRAHATELRATAAAAGRSRMTDAKAARALPAGAPAMPAIPPAILDAAPACSVAAR